MQDMDISSAQHNCTKEMHSNAMFCQDEVYDRHYKERKEKEKREGYMQEDASLTEEICV